MWRELTGTLTVYTGSSGTVTLNNGDIVLKIMAFATTGSPTVAIFGGTAFAVSATSAPMVLDFSHTLLKAGSVGSANTVAFSSTSSYILEVLTPRN